MEQPYCLGGRHRSVGSQGDAGAELPAARRMGHRQHEVLSLRSTVYRILRREGLVKRPEMRLVAGKEYHRKTTGPHQMWATDASYFRVVGWGYYYLVTVMDDYSRFILAHRLQRDMTSDSFIEVVQDAVDRTGMDRVPITDRTRLLSDNGPGYISRAFRDYLGMVGIRHILAAPFHPQANGKLKRYHQTLKRDVNQVPYELPSDLEAAIVAFVSYYNYRRYHKALGNVTPSDVLRGRREEILQRRREVQAQTIERRRQHNMALRELATPQNSPCSLGSQSVPLLLVANSPFRENRDVGESPPQSRHCKRETGPAPTVDEAMGKGKPTREPEDLPEREVSTLAPERVPRSPGGWPAIPGLHAD